MTPILRANAIYIDSREKLGLKDFCQRAVEELHRRVTQFKTYHDIIHGTHLEHHEAIAALLTYRSKINSDAFTEGSNIDEDQWLARSAADVLNFYSGNELVDLLAATQYHDNRRKRNQYTYLPKDELQKSWLFLTDRLRKIRKESYLGALNHLNTIYVDFNRRDLKLPGDVCFTDEYGVPRVVIELKNTFKAITEKDLTSKTQSLISRAQELGAKAQLGVIWVKQCEEQLLDEKGWFSLHGLRRDEVETWIKGTKLLDGTFARKIRVPYEHFRAPCLHQAKPIAMFTYKMAAISQWVKERHDHFMNRRLSA